MPKWHRYHSHGYFVVERTEAVVKRGRKGGKEKWLYRMEKEWTEERGRDGTVWNRELNCSNVAAS